MAAASSCRKDDKQPLLRAAKRIKKTRVSFRDQLGGELVEVVGVSDGADVETEPGPVGVTEGSLVGKYESLVQITVIPKGKEQSSVKGESVCHKGVTNKLQEVLKKVKTVSRSGIHDDLYGESFSGKVGSSWAYSSVSSANRESSLSYSNEGVAPGSSSSKLGNDTRWDDGDSEDDLFGD
ncbi:hypothetical protein Nepgr_007057 [Nepenthes gracilis]|uniref:Uncharacterized protein n=1 Tax=Nepenthes gracilis TaxID=150966 RepID=A0AAD3XHX2_NEPGR|nr:hypothetical protein Nepgr_007057 [Nepenthes gracilis]